MLFSGPQNSAPAPVPALVVEEVVGWKVDLLEGIGSRRLVPPAPCEPVVAHGGYRLAFEKSSYPGRPRRSPHLARSSYSIAVDMVAGLTPSVCPGEMRAREKRQSLLERNRDHRRPIAPRP